MKKILYIVSALAILVGISSCWKEVIPESGVSRHQVENLKATPGDEEVVLSWTMPEKHKPTDFLITYNDDKSVGVSVRTGGEMTYTVTGLVNEYTYSFGVQAVYGTAISGKVEAKGKPTTSRLPIVDPIVDAGDKYVTIIWTKPSDLVQSYTITYYIEGDEANAQKVTVDKDALNYTFENLTNDKTYVFVITVNYAKGESEKLTLNAMPAFAIPYFVSSTSAAQGQPVTYTFNREDYSNATDVTWTFPDGAVKTGDEVVYGINATGEQEVILTAKVNGVNKEWKIAITLRQFVVEFISEESTGFKASYPVFSPDAKTVYNITFANPTILYAIDVATGVTKWQYKPEVTSASYNPATVNPVTGDIYFGTTTAGQFYAVTSEGALKWQFTEAGSMKSTAPAVSADGSVVYIIDANGNLYALDAATGSAKWNKALGKGGSALLVNGDELVVATQQTENSILFLNRADGSELKALSTSRALTDIVNWAVAPDKKTAYIPQKDPGGLVAVNLETKEIIKEVQVGDNHIYAPVVAPNGNVCVGCKDSNIYCLKGDLSEVLWTVRCEKVGETTNNAYNYSHPCASADNKFYISSGQVENITYVLDAATGAIVQSSTYASYVSGEAKNQKQMGGNNLVNGVLYSAYVGTTADKGAMVGTYIGAERAFWGASGGDICGSNCLQSPLL